VFGSGRFFFVGRIPRTGQLRSGTGAWNALPLPRIKLVMKWNSSVNPANTRIPSGRLWCFQFKPLTADAQAVLAFQKPSG
jgi:hypothetical protein